MKKVEDTTRKVNVGGKYKNFA